MDSLWNDTQRAVRFIRNHRLRSFPRSIDMTSDQLIGDHLLASAASRLFEEAEIAGKE